MKPEAPANKEPYEQTVVRELQKKGQTLAIAESCTGGLVAHLLTNVPGASNILLISWVVYSEQAKIQQLGIPAPLIRQHGVVSQPVAEALCVAAQKKSGANYGLGITGIAGPGGGTLEKPVGLIHLALATHQAVFHKKIIFTGNRAQIKYQAAQNCLHMLFEALIP